MKLEQEWKQIIKKAWSIRLMVVAGALSGVEAILPFFSDTISRRPFAILSFVFVAAAFVARLVAQQDVANG